MNKKLVLLYILKSNRWGTFFYTLNTQSNCMPIGCYLLYDLHTYFLCIILDYKNLQFKKLINDIVIDLGSSRNFANIENIRK